MADYDADLLDNRAQKPAAASGDGGSVSQHPLPAQMDYYRFIRSNEAVQSAKCGLNMRKFKASGTVSERS